jgi:hypothetical protein
MLLTPMAPDDDVGTITTLGFLAVRRVATIDPWGLGLRKWRLSHNLLLVEGSWHARASRTERHHLVSARVSGYRAVCSARTPWTRPGDRGLLAATDRQQARRNQPQDPAITEQATAAFQSGKCDTDRNRPQRRFRNSQSGNRGSNPRSGTTKSPHLSRWLTARKRLFS